MGSEAVEAAAYAAKYRKYERDYLRRLNHLYFSNKTADNGNRMLLPLPLLSIICGWWSRSRVYIRVFGFHRGWSVSHSMSLRLTLPRLHIKEIAEQSASLLFLHTLLVSLRLDSGLASICITCRTWFWGAKTFSSLFCNISILIIYVFWLYLKYLKYT